MSDSISIRILEKDTNRRGDLFGRLMADLFVALGYEQPRMNIHKSGRELDLSADHRLEPRRAIGECKATADPIGGDDLNKFVGALDVEHEDKRPVTGYFISLGGFKETAIEQEKQRRRTKIITLNGTQVLEELVNGRILIAKDRATELAGRCCASLNCTLDSKAELLAHERGWIWAIYYTQGKERTHYALVHSDGTLLARAIAEQVIAADRDCGGELFKITCANPNSIPGSDTDPRVLDALSAYGQYIVNECGYIQLDGLPADSDVGSRRLKLENLFVPLHLDVSIKAGGEKRKMERQDAGTVIKDYPRLALLAAPGGGKSTLIKRLAVAYADPARRGQIDDRLPSQNWLPLFFRCRELRGLARGSFAELLEALSQREPVRQHAAIFRAYVDRALLAGRVILLVDGLDEISDQGDRAAFVCTIRTALQAYPAIAVVVTSREAGFRHVAAHLAPVCTAATLSPFNADDIRRLSVAWHREVVGDTEKVRHDAEQLAYTIVRNDRINRLAVNPLLLTTLLLVKRWVGSLPTRRAVLYGKAVEVLLMTWNTEGHEPIADEEALPQLCYVASAMMLAKVERISRRRLSALLQEARSALPTELGYVAGTVEDFIHRIEDRSSLLMMTGHDVEDGQLVEFFEFRHLTFQEFLTARAVVEGWHPGRKDADTLVAVLEPHLPDEKWREVIPLAAVLGGKETEDLIRRLTELVNSLDKRKSWEAQRSSVFVALGHCLADEAAARPETIRKAIQALVSFGLGYAAESISPALLRSRYGKELRDEAERTFVSTPFGDGRHVGTIKTIVWHDACDAHGGGNSGTLTGEFLNLLSRPDLLNRCKGALGCASWLEMRDRILKTESERELLMQIGDALVPLLFSEKPAEQYAAGWALYNLGVHQIWIPPAQPDVLGRMFELWQHSPAESVRSGLLSTLTSQPLASRDDKRRCASINREAFGEILKHYAQMSEIEQFAALIVAWYLHAMDDVPLAQNARTLLQAKERLPAPERTLKNLLERLGQEAE